MLTVDMLLKKAMKGELDLMGPAKKIADELFDIPYFDELTGELFEDEHKYIKNFKKVILMVAGSAAQKLMMQLAKEQEVLMCIADMAIWTYTAESVVLRTQKLISMKGKEACTNQIAMAQVYVYDVADKINKAAKDALTAFAEGDELRVQLMGVKRFTKTNPLNTKALRQQVAQKLIEENKYCF
jgi:precorrin-6x reductase